MSTLPIWSRMLPGSGACAASVPSAALRSGLGWPQRGARPSSLAAISLLAHGRAGQGCARLSTLSGRRIQDPRVSSPPPGKRALSLPLLLAGHRAFSTSRLLALASTSRRPASQTPTPRSGDTLTQARNAYYSKRNQSLLFYTAAVFIFGLGVTYAAVPFYRMFCSATGFGGTPMTKYSDGGGLNGVGEGRFEPSRLVPTQFSGPASADGKEDRIRVTFNSDTSDSLPWTFTPVTKEIHVLPGETALAFFAAKNRGPKDIVGIATYNVAPDRIAPYFAKVECFCFEEQKLLAGEDVDLPVFFFIDRDMLDDPTVKDVREVVLSYTFFSARRNEKNGQLEPDTDLSTYTVGKDL